jgi:hypothetical protein
MKLKRFSQFIAESKVNEDASATVEESAFLVDNAVYLVGEVELEIETSYDEPDRDVGYHGGYSAESWSIYGIDSVYKVTDSDIVAKIEDIKNQSGELSTMGFSDLNINDQIEDLIFNADSEEVTGPELAALDKRIVELDRAGQLIDLTGTFDKRCDAAVERAMEDYEEDGPDYDYDRDDY